MKLFTNRYVGRTIKLTDQILKFEGNLVEVEDSIGEEILKAGYAGIYSVLPEEKPKADDLLIEGAMEMKASLEAEIIRLKGIITSKDKEILTLKADIDSWKNLATGNDNSEVAEEVLMPTDAEDPIANLKKAELVEMAVGEGYLTEKEASAMLKQDLIDLIKSKVE